MEYYAIDRIEENYAVCEKDGETMVNISRALLPDGARAMSCAACRTARSCSTARKKNAAAKQLLNSWTVCLMNKFSPLILAGCL